MDSLVSQKYLLFFLVILLGKSDTRTSITLAQKAQAMVLVRAFILFALSEFFWLMGLIFFTFAVCSEELGVC